MAFQLDIAVPSSHVPWGATTGDADIWIEGIDWSAGTYVMSFKYLATDTSAAITLSNASAGTQGISATYDATYISTRTGSIVGGTRVRAQIDEATLEGLTWGTLTSLALVYDLLVTPSGSVQQVICYGTMTIRKGVAD